MAGRRIQRYESEAIAVIFDPNICIHAARCLQVLPTVFDVSRRKWIELDAASANEIARAVERCPSGALRYERLDGGPAEVPDELASIRLVANGPLYVRGDIPVLDADGGAFTACPRSALCRCGESQNKPFCDNSHRAVRFRG